MKLMTILTFLTAGFLSSAITIAECTTNRNSAIDISKPDSIYTDHGDGTVTDNNTGLMWQKCSLGLSGSSCTTGSAETYTWQASLAIANDNTDYGYSDWRLPNKIQLKSLTDNACYDPSINETLFPNTVLGKYWSASPYSTLPSFTWGVEFRSGGDIFNDNKNNIMYVRLVRDSY